MVWSWEQDLRIPSKCESERKKVGLLISKWSVKVLFRSMTLDPQPRVMALELLKNFMIEFIFWFLLAKAHPLPLFNWRGIDSFSSLSSSNIEIWEKEKFGKCIKVPIGVQGCNFTWCRLNNSNPLLTTNCKCKCKMN